MSESTPRPSKRIRLDDSRWPSYLDCDTSVSLIQDEEFWFDDGTIIVVAEDVGFKVYRGLLASQSSVFEDMFAAGSSEASETIGGCPVVRLQDAVVELRHLLRALISKTGVPYATEDAQARTFDQLYALTSLAHKYEIDPVQQWAVTVLKTHYADTFTQWNSPPSFVSQPELGQGIGAIRLARLTNNPTMLPVAFYECAVLGGDIAKGWVREDGRVEHLDGDDLKRCIDGYGKLCRMVYVRIEDVFGKGPSELCTSIRSCHDKLKWLYYDLLGGKWTSVALAHYAEHAIDRWAAERSVRICEACIDKAKETDRGECRRLWSGLPTIFDLSKWTELASVEQANRD